MGRRQAGRWWLRAFGLGLALAASGALAAVGVNKTFNPTNVSAGQSSTLTVILLNNNASPATAVAFTDNLPGTVVVATPANTTTSCGAAVTATSGAANFSVSGGTIPAASGGIAGQCTVTVDVMSPSAGVFINNIPAGAVSSSQGTNPQNANATLTVAALQPVTGAKAFLPATLHGGGGTSTVTLTLTNPNGVALTNASLTDTLPVASLAIAAPPNATTTCGAGAVGTGANTATLTGGTIPANGSCTIKFDVVAANPNVYVDGNVANTIPIGALSTTQGVSNAVAFAANVRLQTGARVEKVFAPTPITTGGTSTLTVTVRDFNTTPLVGSIAFTDTFPAGMSVAAPVVTGTTCVGLAFTPVPVAGNTAFTVSGGGLPGATAGSTNNANCTVTINVTATNAGANPITLNNTIPVGNFGGVGYSSGTGSLVVNAVTSVGGSKSFAPTPILQGGVSTLTITLTNSAAVPATITSFTDALTTLGANPQFTVAAAPPATTTCGGVLNAAPGANTITLGAGNSIPAGGNCTITVPVQASATASTGARTNSIAQGALVTSQGRTQAAITGVLTVNPVLSVAKAFAPLTVAAGTDTRATITLTRAAGAVALSGLAFTDTLPAGHLVSATPNLVNNCGGAVTATSGTNTISLAGGALAGGAGATSCTILVNVTTPAGAGSGTNTIAAGAVGSTQGFVNPAAASATVTRVVTSVTVNKSFSPATVLVGGTSQLTINFINTNANAIALTAGALTDNLPIGMAVAAAPGASNTCGGTFTPLAGATSVSLTNASIAANASCRVQVNVVANAAGNLINLLVAGRFTSAQGVTNPLPASATLAATGVANLGITKTDGVASVVPGTSTTYTIVASNAGPNAVAGASVVDNPPAGLTFTSWTCAASVGSSCGNASGSGPINELVSLLNAGTATYTVIAAIAPDATGTITNTVTIIVPPTVVDPTPANNTASDTDTLTPVSALAVSKTDGSATYTPGGTATYTVVVTNAGPSNAINGTVSDPLPAGVTLGANATCVATGTANCGTVTGTTGQASFGTTGATVGAGAGNSLTFTVPVAFASGLITNPLINTVTVTDPTSPPASASDSDARAAVAALVVSKTDGSPTYTPGGAATYTVVVTNAGPSNASSVTVSDPLPAGVTLSANATCVPSGAATCGVVTGTTGQTSFGTTGATIAAGAGNGLTFSVPVSFASGMLTNPLVNTVTATDPSSPPATGSDSDARAAVAALSVTKTDGSVTYTPGGAATYTVTVSNAGPSNANSVTVSDPLPAGVTLNANATCVASGTATCGTVTGTTGQTSFGTTGATIPAGAANKLTFTAPVAFASGMSTNPLVNTATGTDPASPPATGSDSDTLAAVAALAVSKTDGSATYTPGGSATYTVVVTNAGPSNAANVTLSDPLPAGVTLTANATCVATGSASCGTVTGTTGQTSFGATSATVGAGAGNSLTFTAPVAFAAGMVTNPLVNTATATDPSSAPATGSDSDARAAVASLAVTKTDGSATYTPGGTATYTVVVTNAGPSNANSVTLSDPLPAGVTLNANATCVASGAANCGTVTGTTGQTSFGTTGATVGVGAGNSLTFTVPVAFASGMLTDPLTNTATATDPASPPATGSDSDTRAAVAALAVTKTDGSATYTPGGTATYTVTVTNAGPSNANSVMLTDPLPAGVTLNANATCVATGTANCGVVTGTTGQTSFGTTGATIAAGAANKLTFTVPAAFASGLATNPLVNTATATDPASPPASGSDSDARAAVAALSVTKTDGSATYTPGNTATYTVVVSNAGPSNASSVTVSDPLPAGVTLSANATCVASGTSNCGTVTGTTGQTSFGTTGATVIAGAGNQLTFTVPVSFAPGMTTNPLVNTATATDPASPPATGSDSDTLSAQVSLNVVKTDGSATYTPGGTATYTITVTNGGPSSATNVTVTDALPAGVTLSANATCVASGTASCGTVTGTTGQTSFGTTSASIGAGAANKLVFTVPVAFAASMVADPIINSATATDLTSSGPSSTATGTDTDSRSATVALNVVKTDGSATYTPGGNATYTVTVTNGGPSVATNMTITDPLPAGVTLTANATCVASGTATCGAVTGTTGQASFGTTGATIGAAAADKLVFTVPVAFASSMITDPLVNTATVTDLGASGAGSIATGSDSDARAAAVTLLVSKTDGATTYTPGGTATYTVTVENTGTSDALDVTVTDTLPAGLTITASAICVANGTSSCGTVTGTTGQTSFGTTGAAIVPGGANTIVFTIPVAFGAGMSTDPLVNMATATDVPTGATANGSDSDTLSSNVTLAVAKTDGSATYTPGGTATYTVTVVNTGLSDALNVNVTDALPAGVTLNANATCVANGSSSCGTVTGATGQTSFGATAARVDAGGANTLVFTVPVTFAPGMTTTPLVNTATATDVVSGNTASGSDSDTLSAVVTLGVAKTDGSATYTPGGTATYTVTVANTGLSDALNVTVTDPLPAGVTLSANATCVAGGTSSCGTVTGTTGQTSFGATIARIDAGAANAIVFTVPVAFASGMTTTPLINTATATDIPTGITANGSDSDVLSANVSLAVTKTDGSATYTPGGTAIYTVTVANTGVSDALDVTVADPLPAGVTLNANAICVGNGTSSCGAVTGTTGQTSFGTTAARVDAGGANTLTFTVPVAFAAGMITNPLVNTASATDVTSGATANGSDIDALASNVTLGVTKTDGSATYTPGGTATYVVTVTNTGVSDALNVTAIDPLPAGVTLNANASCVASGSSSCGTVTGTTGQTSFGTTAARVSVGAGNALVFTVPVAFAPGMSTNPLVNTATATDVPTGATASGSDSDTLVAAAGLAVTKTDGSATYTPGGTATYTVVVTNGGPSNAANLTVTDNLPVGVTLSANATCVTTGAATCGAVTGATGATSFGTTAATLAAGAGNALTFTAPVSFAASLATDPLINTVTASDPAAPGPVSASDSDTRAPVADVGIVKTGPATLIAGSAITYTLTLTNAGPSAANGATFNDNVPAIIGGVAAVCGGAAGGATCGAVSVVGNTVSGIVPLLPVGGSVVITITGNISGTAAGSFTNIGTISAPIGTSDPTPNNSSSSVTTTVGATTANQIPVNAPWALALLLAAIGLFGAQILAWRGIPRR